MAVFLHRQPFDSILPFIQFAIAFFVLPDAFDALLSVHPPVLFLDEDWPLNRPLDVKICTDRRVEDSLELRILSGNEAELDINGIGLPLFGIVTLNKTCSGLVLYGHLDVDSIDDKQLNGMHKMANSNSYSLLIENLDNKERAALQIEIVDVNDNSPRFLGGPFPIELVIPVDSPPGFLLRRLEVFDPDKGIGGISRFFLNSPNNRSRQLFALEAQQCEWPKCWVELHLREPMAEGERAELKVKARDGAGLTQKKANEAEVEIRVLAVGEGPNPVEEANEEEETDMGSNPFESDQQTLEKAVRGIANSRKSVVQANLTTTMRKLSTTVEPPEITAPLITFDKKASGRAQTPLPAFTLPKTTPITTTIGDEDTELAINLPSTIQSSFPPILPLIISPPSNFVIDPLSEDSPIGLELLRIPLGNSKSGLQFIQLDGSHSLRMLPDDGSIQLAAELDAEMLPELKAEIRKADGHLLATLRANVRSMAKQFGDWLGKIEGEIRLNQSDLIGSKSHVRRILWLPQSLAKYARVDSTTIFSPNMVEFKLTGRELLLTDLQAGRHCCHLELEYREKRMGKQICVEVPEKVVQIEMHWPANNSRHFFKENFQYPILLTFNATGPPTMFYAIDQAFQDGPLFSIDPSNGQLFLQSPSKQFDYEAQSQFSLAIFICPTNTIEKAKCRRICLQLEILDANDYCPHFEPSSREQPLIELSEAAKPDLTKPIGQFPMAIDADSSEGQRLICYRLEESGGGIFGIQAAERPELYLLKSVDRELVPNYQLKIVADDCPWIDQKCPKTPLDNNSLTIFIKILDVNDNPPRFARRHFFAALLRPFHPGEALLQLQAEDPDELDRGRLRFAWGEGMVQTDGDPLPIADCPFKLNRSSGELSLREDFSTSHDELERLSTFTFRVRVRDKAPVHEDQAAVTISILDPTRHLVQLSLSLAGVQLEQELPHLERLLSAMTPERGWLAQVHRMTECGGANCTELAIYLLDRAFRPIEAKLAVEGLTKAGKERPGQMRELRQKFGLMGIEVLGKLRQQDHFLRATSPAAASNQHIGPIQWIRHLFALSPLALIAAFLLAIFALACPFLCCRLICRQIQKCQSERGPKLLSANRATLGAFGEGTLGCRGNLPFGQGQGGIRLMMVAAGPGNGQQMNKAAEGGGERPTPQGNEFLNENAYIAPQMVPTMGREHPRRLRWQTESEDFEFPAPPPVQMYGSSGTLTIPRAKSGAGAKSVATEF